MNVQDVLVVLAIGVATVYLAYRAWRRFSPDVHRGGPGCGCGKSSCPTKSTDQNGEDACRW